MRSGIKIALIVLQILEKLFENWQDKKLIDETTSKLIAESNARMLGKSQHAKQALVDIGLLSDDAVDERLRGLEP